MSDGMHRPPPRFGIEYKHDARAQAEIDALKEALYELAGTLQLQTVKVGDVDFCLLDLLSPVIAAKARKALGWEDKGCACGERRADPPEAPSSFIQEVKCCWDCPFLSFYKEECGDETPMCARGYPHKKTDPHRNKPPEWCGLRQHDVLVVLSKKSET